MLGLDDASSAMDTASQMLAGGSNNPAAPATPAGDATYLRGIHIDTEDPGQTGATSHNLQNERDLNLLLEFIHFGNVHTTYSNFFPHPSYQDNEKEDKILQGARPRAIQFRSALQREAILLSVFMECTQTVLQDRDNSKSNLADPASLASGSAGALGTAMDTLGSLTGAGGGGSGQSTAASVNDPIQKTVAAIKPLLVETIKYPDVHKAGCDLQQARWDYRALLKTISTEKPSSSASSSLLGKLPGLSGAAGPVGDIISFAQGVAFQPEDIKVKFFAKVAAQQEIQIETACHAMTLQAIADGLNPVLPVWFGDPDAKAKKTQWDSAPASPLQRDNDSSNLLGKAINPVADRVTDARNTAVDKANDAKDFFENPIPPTPPPGADFLDQAFDVPKPTQNKNDPVPMAVSALAVQAFIEALGLPSPLNSVCEGVIAAVFGIALDFIQGTYEALLARDPDATITDESLYTTAASRLKLVDRLLSLASDQVGFIKTLQQASLSAPMGYTVGVGQLIDKEGNKLDDVIADKIGPIMQDALKLAMQNLAQHLDLARQDGNTNKCLTMEWYLGRLPWVQSTLFFDLFFPFWNALLQCIMNVVDPAAASAIKAIVGVANSVKSKLDAARDDLAKAQALKTAATNTVNRAGQGVNMLDPSQVGALGAGYGDAMNQTASKTAAPTVDRGNFTLAVTNRSETGTGIEVAEADYDQVKPYNQWNGATTPNVPKKDDDKSPSWASAT